MSATAVEQARVIGFLTPEVAPIHIRRGEKFTIRGVLLNGSRYELHHVIIDFDGRSITLSVDGVVGNNAIKDIALKFPFVVNHPLRLPLPFGPPIYIAFITPSASNFRAVPNAPLNIALGEVRNTVPPPPPK